MFACIKFEQYFNDSPILISCFIYPFNEIVIQLPGSLSVKFNTAIVFDHSLEVFITKIPLIGKGEKGKPPQWK